MEEMMRVRALKSVVVRVEETQSLGHRSWKEHQPVGVHVGQCSQGLAV